MARYPITIFLSAFLLFQVQPLIAKVILPWFGGGPTVWTACMLFFQVVLLGGYSYAHFVSSRFPPRALATVHLVLLAGSLWFLPINPADAWKPSGDEEPVARILGLLLLTIGLPYFLLSTTGPLLQDSFRRETGRAPYRLYSLSNIGSLLALLTYPFVFEPRFTLWTQIVAWSAGYALFVVLGAWCALAFARVWKPTAAAVSEKFDDASHTPRPAIGTILLWLALAACGSVMLLATTNQLCQEVASVPFLWVVPLWLYLFTFVICFDHERWYRPAASGVLLAVVVALAAYALYQGGDLRLRWHLVIDTGALFICCMVCHGELVLAKPAPKYVTLFYLMVAAGGALGGVLVAIVAPLVLRGFWEFQIGLGATVVLAVMAWLARSAARLHVPRGVLVTGGAVSLVLAVATGVFVGRSGDATKDILESSRNFYGVLRVNEEETADNGPRREMIHGTIQHGTQYLEADKKSLPTTYYSRPGGAGLSIERHPRRSATDSSHGGLRIGVVGLGCGTLAAYGRKGDYLRFYEINPDVIRLAEKYFTYCQDTPAEIDIVIGDARVKMEQELAVGQRQDFDVLVVDAFTSDAIPMHLLTKQSVEMYCEHLKPDGLLCLHISNAYLDLMGVVIGIARELGYPCVLLDNDNDESRGINEARYAILTRNWRFLSDPDVAGVSAPCWPRHGEPLVWTDDYGSLWQVLSPN